MSTPEPGLFDRLAERPSLSRRQIAETSRKEIGIRFLAGALTSLASGLLALAFGPKAAGLLLAFPAILAASLTLIEEEEDRAQAREDARGAIGGGIGLAAFAIIGALEFAMLAGGIVLILGALAWLGVAAGLYGALWGRVSLRRPRS